MAGSETRPTWDVVATVNEPPGLVAAFAAWHLEAGADTVHLYFDDPADPAAAMLEGRVGIRVVRCDARRWRDRRPDRHQDRQRRNATQALQTGTAEWLAHIDADEFLRADAGVAAMLSTVPEEVDAVFVKVLERVHPAGSRPRSIVSGSFRRAFRGAPLKGIDLFGPGYGLTSRGHSGYSSGKTILRRDRARQFSVHRGAGEAGADLREIRPSGLRLLHLEGLTPLNWVYKRLRRAEAVAAGYGQPPAAHIQGQIDLILEMPRQAEAIYRSLRVLTPEIEQALRADQMLDEVPLDPRPALARRFPDLRVDLSRTEADRWLWAREDALLDAADLPAALRRSRP